MIEVYTDGSSLGNPGSGGRGAVVLREGVGHEVGGYVPNVTNNQMELRAAIEGLKKVLDLAGYSKESIGSIENNTTGGAVNEELGLFAPQDAKEKSCDPSPSFFESVALYTDSQYVKKGITERMDTWVKRQWRRSKGGQLVMNVEYWKTLKAYTECFEKLERKWVKGHAGNKRNERVDDIARGAAEKRQP